MKTIQEITEARKKAEKTNVSRYHGRSYGAYGKFNRLKSWATKFVDDVFEKSSIEFLNNLSDENKKFVKNYLADGWYYPKYNEKKRAIEIIN